MLFVLWNKQGPIMVQASLTKLPAKVKKIALITGDEEEWKIDF